MLRSIKIEIAGKKFSSEVTVIDLSKKNLKKIPDLSAFKNLIELDLSENNINKIESLNYLKNLKILNLSSNKINKIENLENLIYLEVLDVSQNQIKKIENLNKLKNLGELFLNENKIQNLAALKTIPNLWKLYLEENEIASLSLDDLPKQLHTLYLNNNLIAYIVKPKKKHNKLNTLSLYENPLQTLEWIEFLPKLEEISILRKKLKSISKKSFHFIQQRQSNSSYDHPFYFFTSNTTPTKKIEDFVKKNKIGII